MDDLQGHLVRHDFKTLFVEVLGWDNAAAQHRVFVDGAQFTFQLIAHKRGLQVLVCQADKYTLFNRARLRDLERRVARIAHEHLIIYVCDEPRKQVWQWAVYRQDGRKLRHREHPFFSQQPPHELMVRLRGLRFTLQEEDRVTLTEALDRTRAVLDVKSERNLFVNHPKYAEEGDRLARAAAVGGVDDFHRFVLFHRRLANWGVRRMVRHFGIEEEDAEQFGMVAMLSAAKHFKHEKGFQFSTYATTVIQKYCHRHGPQHRFIVRVPSTAYWRLLRVVRTAERLAARSGDWLGEYFVDWLSRRDAGLGLGVRHFRRAITVRSLCDKEEPERQLARQLPDPHELPDVRSIRGEVVELVRRCLDLLDPRDAEVLRRRYGFGVAPETLETIAQRIDLTKERVRQIVLNAEAALRPVLEAKLGELSTAQITEMLPEDAVSSRNHAADLDVPDWATREVLAVIARVRDIGAVELAAVLRMDRSTRNDALRCLIAHGQVERVGLGRTARYRIAAKVAAADSVRKMPSISILQLERILMQGGRSSHAR